MVSTITIAPVPVALPLQATRMNKTEAAYAEHLQLREVLEGTQLHWLFESVKLRLADKTWYTPDFMVMQAHKPIEFHEVKGFWRDDARVKIKVAAELHTWAKFVAVQWDRKAKAWKREEF